MHAYLVQHGKAKSADEDPNRGLSDEGHAEVVMVAKFLHGLGLTVSLIHHSGKQRADETAHILEGCVRTTAGPTHTTGLNPEDDPNETAEFLNMYTDDILIVGHLPNLERLTSLLLTGDPDRRPIQFRNGGVVCLQKESRGVWRLVWAIAPEILKTRATLAA